MTASSQTSPDTPAEAPPGEFQADPEAGPAYTPETPKHRHKTGRHVAVHGGGATGLGAAATVLHMFGPTGLGIAAAGATAVVGGAVALKNRGKKGKGKSSAARTVRTLTRRTKTQHGGGRAAAGLRGGAAARSARRTTAASGAARAGRRPAAPHRPGAAGARRGAGTAAAARRAPGGTSSAAARRARRAATARGTKPGAPGRTRPASGTTAKGNPKPTAARRGAASKPSRSKPARARGTGGRPIAATRPARNAARRQARAASKPAPRGAADPKTNTPKAPRPARPANRQARIAAHATRKKHVRYIKRAAAANPKTRNKPFGQQARAFAPQAKANVRRPVPRKTTNSTRNNSRKTPPRASAPRNTAPPRVVPGPRPTPTPTVTVVAEPAETTGYSIRPGTPRQTHTTIHLPSTRVRTGSTRPALTGRIIPAPGTPTRSTPAMTNATITSLTEAVRDHLGSWQPESASDIEGMISGLRDFYSELGSAVVGVGEHLASDHPIDASVTEALKQMGMATAQIGEYGREVHATFRAAHAEDLRRLEEPRAGEHEWNTDRNH